ncbi:hypothetical protein DL89DRAFT_140895 [Linderina pennispora]|uniref:Uncharacterized protein n=1 Tax=Linderina pennispora TaxID=61395 RepID=A0A1Y1WB81_9FUNG|nr:uncharacterized protein DL89DRAFT_140895 [Linderina pennispora]ORX70799.1 hypothetical protein DL89DRAFT_140895 [Linderina pennispora]
MTTLVAAAPAAGGASAWSNLDRLRAPHFHITNLGLNKPGVVPLAPTAWQMERGLYRPPANKMLLELRKCRMRRSVGGERAAGLYRAGMWWVVGCRNRVGAALFRIELQPTRAISNFPFLFSFPFAGFTSAPNECLLLLRTRCTKALLGTWDTLRCLAQTSSGWFSAPE